MFSYRVNVGHFKWFTALFRAVCPTILGIFHPFPRRLTIDHCTLCNFRLVKYWPENWLKYLSEKLFLPKRNLICHPYMVAQRGEECTYLSIHLLFSSLYIYLYMYASIHLSLYSSICVHRSIFI